MDSLRFDNTFKNRILRRDKYITVRWWDSKMIEPGDRVKVVCGDRMIGTAKILSMGKVTLKEFVELNPEGHRQYEDWVDLHRNLHTFYPKIPRDPNTEVYMITFLLEDNTAVIDTDWGVIRL